MGGCPQSIFFWPPPPKKKIFVTSFFSHKKNQRQINIFLSGGGGAPTLQNVTPPPKKKIYKCLFPHFFQNKKIKSKKKWWGGAPDLKKFAPPPKKKHIIKKKNPQPGISVPFSFPNFLGEDTPDPPNNYFFIAFLVKNFSKMTKFFFKTRKKIKICSKYHYSSLNLLKVPFLFPPALE